MEITTALVPFQGFLPSRASIDGFGVEHDKHYHRRQEGIVVGVYSSDDSDGIYGPDGEVVVKQNIGEFINIYA